MIPAPLFRVYPSAFALTVILACAAPVLAADPLFTLSSDGTVFEYRARPGDTMAAIAGRFGIDDPAGIAELQRANGIDDATRIPTGHVFRVPNVAAVRAANAAAAAATAAARQGETELRAERDALQAERDRLAAEADVLRRAVRLLPARDVALVLLIVIAVGAVGLARVAAAKERRMEQYARTLSTELEQKRKAGLAERQETAKRILDLEAQLREVEAVRGSRRPARLVAAGKGGVLSRLPDRS
jgi:hypothetical protein